MAASLNKVILIGHLGSDPQVRMTQEGTKIALFSVATNETWTDKGTGEKKDRTEWHRIVVLNEHFADMCERFLKKGSRVYVEGQLKTKKWTDKAGQDRYTTEIVLSRYKGELIFLDSKDSLHAPFETLDAPSHNDIPF